MRSFRRLSCLALALCCAAGLAWAEEPAPDLTFRERMLVVPVTALFFVVGLDPQLLLGKLNATVMMMVEQLRF